jgi:DNA (cytosine-5)-methyltransferase 1
MVDQLNNHYAASLSTLDREIISYVPQGGNWKDIPESVPSQRLENIRVSYREGKGSRSTYYGRMREDMPAHTISTYFPRPGNGCNIHYDQDRTITQREAARLQSFPDSFTFYGSISAINNQIGNAVPPLLGYQIAEALPFKGQFIDLFAGAGGLALGFTWAGWKPVIANDIDASALVTHAANIPGETIAGDIQDQRIIEQIMQTAKDARRLNPRLPLFILGGPPCQGFSTANYRTPKDQRNWLFKAYAKLVEEIRPAGFIFENVTGITNFEKGAFFSMILDELGRYVEAVKPMKVNCANFGIPQRRERVVVVGGSTNLVTSFELLPVTRVRIITKAVSAITNRGVSECSPVVCSTRDALSDLPKVLPGEDGSNSGYLSEPKNDYQALMRGSITPKDYLEKLRNPI